MIIYEVNFKDIDGSKQSVYFPNRRTTNSFVVYNLLLAYSFEYPNKLYNLIIIIQNSDFN